MKFSFNSSVSSRDRHYDVDCFFYFVFVSLSTFVQLHATVIPSKTFWLL